MTPKLTLFGLARSVYTRIARMTLEVKALPYALNEVEIFGPEGVPADHLLRHPFGRIPVLDHGSFRLYETQAICRYLDESFPGVALQPSSAPARARVAQVAGLLDAYAYRPMVWGVFVPRVRAARGGGPADESAIRAALPAVERALDALAALQDGARYLVGDALTLADLHAYPMLRYLDLAPEGRAAIATRPALARWLAMMQASAVAVGTRTEYESADGG